MLCRQFQLKLELKFFLLLAFLLNFDCDARGLLPDLEHEQKSKEAKPASLFIGAQHWNESGWYADGFKQHYDGYFCLCECHDTAEGTFCKGGGMKPDGMTKVADFLGVFSQARDSSWVGDLAAYNTPTPFADHFTLLKPGGPSNYTGVSQALGDKSFVWRGYMSGVDCQFAPKCVSLCEGVQQFQAWHTDCSKASM
ncbi:hypothetical protein CYMTET_42075 [Cymbomonas tetramitiformis]|uniref:Secreted protein n=1 Tax=Cymbomonas tetramitiformis TaxID=36881 RepID=A0AAE0C6S0_9CHLO|nr:hypothetical protein CYMTET_42075 [Cymbomonas tetramitiformis]|eukprot:gene15948-18907_t